MPDGHTETSTSAPQPSPSQPAAPPKRGEFARELDQLSLEQALIDFEIANARVIDLTRRLVEAGEELAELRNSHELLRIEHTDLRKRHDILGSSRALRVAAAVRPLRQLLRR